jgi:hypothetical protein
LIEGARRAVALIYFITQFLFSAQLVACLKWHLANIDFLMDEALNGSPFETSFGNNLKAMQNGSAIRDL